MKSAAYLLKNTLLLAFSSIVLRLIGLCFQAYLAAKVGAQELGVFGIISSVGVVFATISISGVRFSVTRLVAERVSCGNDYPRSLMRCAFSYSAVFGFLSGIVLYVFAPLFSRYWVMDLSAAPALRLMALSMPLISFGAAVEGYFTAKQKVFRLVATELFAQLIRISFVAGLFTLLLKNGTRASVILAAGSFAGESVLSITMLVLYFFESWGRKEQSVPKGTLPRLIKTAFPLAVSAYMRTGLSSLGQIIIPRGLRKGGMGSAGAFTTYGIIAQMAMPVIMFPAALLNALGEILVPRLTDAQVMGHKIGISYIVNRALRIGMIFSFGVAGIMLFYSSLLGEAIYKNAQAGYYIKIFAPLVPIVYIDCVTDGCLKGLNQQLHSMVYNVLEGALNVVLLFILLPKIAIMGYVVVMYVKEIFNAVLSLARLTKVTAVDKSYTVLFTTTLSTVGAYVFGNIVAPVAPIFPKIAIYVCFYVSLLYVSNAVTREDIRWVLALIRPQDNVSLYKWKKM